MTPTTEKTFVLEPDELLSFCGPRDQRIRQLQDHVAAQLLTRGNEIVVTGEADDVARAARLIDEILAVQRRTGRALTRHQFQVALRSAGEAKPDERASLADVLLDEIPLPSKLRNVAPMTHGQKRYVESMRRSDVVFAVGPAGTGKTYLAVAMGVWHLIESRVRRIILVRPAVEAGEKLGFLPGDIAAKFDPFVRPLYDALYDMIDPEQVRTYLDTGVIEVAPLAFMRGRTLNNSFVILDEGQNTTTAQMKMFLTRLGYDSKAVVTGDVTQIDLPEGKTSGLVHATRVLRGLEGIEFVEFGRADVVRHSLVQKIIQAYEKNARPARRKH